MELALLFIAMSHTFNLPHGMLSAVCYVESHHHASAVNHDDGKGDSLGLCQVHLATARQMGYKGSASNLLKPDINMFWAASYLKWQLARYKGNPAKAIAAYNSGSLRLDDVGNLRNIGYLDKVIDAWSKGL